MHFPNLILTVLLTWTPSCISWTTTKDPKNAVLLSKVRTLTLRHGSQTTHRRVSPIPQLNCIGGNAQGLYEVDVMRCKNSGSEYDAEDIQWTCQASLPPEFKLGSTDVICEGFDSPEDPYILKGSCGVEYRLMLTELGERKYAGYRTEEFRRKGKGEGGLSDSAATKLFWFIFIAVACVILYNVFKPRMQPAIRDALRRGGGGGGGGAGGDDDDPPPPYTPQARPKSKPKKSSTTWGDQSYRSSPSSTRSSGPGFWTGAATGAAAGYAASAWQNRNRTQQQPPRAGPSSWFGRSTYDTPPPAQAGPSNWFGRGRDTTYEYEPTNYGAGPSSYRSSYGAGSSSSPPAPSSSRHESTGFGGTTRR